MKNIVIVGSSGFAREVRWLIERINDESKQYNFLGYIDQDIKKDQVIGDDNYIIQYPHELDVVIAIANPQIRKSLFKRYRVNPNLKFPNIIDPSVLMSDSIEIGQGNIICAGSILTVDVQIENFCIINLDCTVGHEVCLESYVTLNPSVNVSGNAYLEEGVNVGTGTQIIQGKRIGKYTVIGAGAVVIGDISECCTAVGIPAKEIAKGKGDFYANNNNSRGWSKS